MCIIDVYITGGCVGLPTVLQFTVDVYDASCNMYDASVSYIRLGCCSGAIKLGGPQVFWGG